MNKFISIWIFFALEGCSVYDCYNTPFNYKECMSSAYSTYINASLTGTKMELVIPSVLLIHLDCLNQKKKWDDICPYEILKSF